MPVAYEGRLSDAQTPMSPVNRLIRAGKLPPAVLILLLPTVAAGYDAMANIAPGPTSAPMW